MENTIENAVRFYEKYPDNGVISMKSIGECMVAYASAVRPEVKLPDDKSMKIYVSSFGVPHDSVAAFAILWYQDEIKRLNGIESK